MVREVIRGVVGGVMMDRINIGRGDNPESLGSYKRYIREGKWKCLDAPINPDLPLNVQEQCGAHYWLELSNEGRGAGGRFYCKYCLTIRRFRTTWDGQGSS